MMQFTEEQRNELLAEIDYNRKHCFLSSKTELLMRIAEAALTAEPVAQFYKSEHGNVFNTLNDWNPTEGANHLYPAPPVAALKLPDVLIPYPSNDVKGLAHNAGWNACLAEVKRLNATAREEKPE